MEINSFSVILTYRCNLNCLYCLRKPNRVLGDVPLDQLRELILQFKKQGLRNVSLTGGEATLYPYFWELMTFLGEQDLTVFIESNGINLTAPFLGRLTKIIPKEKLSFLISLDSWRPEIHDAERGKGAFAKAVLAAGNLKSLGIKTSTNLVIRGGAVPGLMDFFRYFDLLVSLGITTSHLSPVVAMGRGRKLAQKLNTKEIISIGHSLARFRRRYANRLQIETGLDGFVPQKRMPQEDPAVVTDCERLKNPCFSFKGFHPCLYLDDWTVPLVLGNDNFDFLNQFSFLRKSLLLEAGVKKISCGDCVKLFQKFRTRSISELVIDNV